MIEGDCEVLSDAEETDGDNTCCLHPARRGDAGDLVCCWCGDLFMSPEPPRSRHGEYAPKPPRQRKAKP